ncbi:MAG TPA: hypothetical protein VK363_01795 [Pyrinomonadaceae bacterium]|nr:hypothetical protein [Pyrinomonadaceae bacterium]
MCTPDKSQIARDVLAYLAEHPDAQDTFEGIVEWWLLEQKIKRQTAEVREVLDNLASRKLILERRAADSRTHYRLNRRKVKAINAFLKPENL